MKHYHLLGFISLAAATPLMAAPCVSAPLNTYTSAGFTCEVDSAIFSNFDFTVQTAGGGDILGESDITVSPIVEMGIVGLRFSGVFQSTGGPDGPGVAQGNRTNEYRFFFDVTRPGSIFTAVGSRLNDPLRVVQNPLKFGSIFATNYATNDGAQAFAFDTDVDLTDFATLNTERLVVPVDNFIHLTAGASAAGTMAPVGFASLASADFLYEYRNLDVVVPEPSTWALFISGIGLIALSRLRRRKRSH